MTWRARIVLALFATSVAAFAAAQAERFLTIAAKVPSENLVVEGWIHDYAVREAVSEFRKGGYRAVYCTGGPVVGTGKFINVFQTSAGVGADLLRKHGISESCLHVVPSREMSRHRTYSAAIALREYFRLHRIKVNSFNVVTENAHARRTRLLYQKAFGPDVQVGVIAIPPADYPAHRWWQYSDGVKEIISESAAYLYVRLFFWPASP